MSGYSAAPWLGCEWVAQDQVSSTFAVRLEAGRAVHIVDAESGELLRTMTAAAGRPAVDAAGEVLPDDDWTA